MHYSITHDWQATPNVKQVLVFPDARDKDDFEREHLIREDDRLPFTDSQFVDATAKGIFVKLRAVLDGDDKWIPIIRTADGTTIKAFFDIKFSSWQLAIDYAKAQLKSIAG